MLAFLSSSVTGSWRTGYYSIFGVMCSMIILAFSPDATLTLGLLNKLVSC